MLAELTDYRLHPELPIFALADGSRCLVYVPGHVLPLAPSVVADLAAEWGSSAVHGPTMGVGELGSQVERLGRDVWQAWCAERDREFRPECLNLQFGHGCNLVCRYCYAAEVEPAAKRSEPVGSDLLVRAAAEAVAVCCAERRKPFCFVVQGLGEPTAAWESLVRSVTVVRTIAARYRLDWVGHVTTNGQFTEQQAIWLSEHFTQVGLSCDGPPDVQDRQRPRRDGAPSSHRVEHAAEWLVSRGVDVEVRATVVPDTVWRIGELVEYVADRLGVARLRVEPDFRPETHWQPGAARAFVQEVLAAERLAAAREIELRLCSPRLDELHGPLCEAARDALRLLPDGTVANCFLPAANPAAAPTPLGQFDSACGCFRWDQAALHRARVRSFAIPAGCRECFNQLHCVRTCPEACPWMESGGQPSFRCLVQKELARQWIWQAACSAGKAAPDPRPTVVCRPLDAGLLRPYLAGLPDMIDGTAIAADFTAASQRYRLAEREMPSPPWVQRGFDVGGAQAWDALRHRAAVPSVAPLSVYVHIPFCRQRCQFCDCHSFPFRESRAREYVARLIQHLRIWTEQTAVASRPVTTIHFGGGTPNSLGDGQLEPVVDACRRTLRMTPETELAIETTAGLCHSRELVRLWQLGFRRLHVGVQTLDPVLRSRLGRRTPSPEVLDRLQRAVAMGFVTSVDLIYGLPGQDANTLIDTLVPLIAGGVHGVSIYRLNRSPKNSAFWQRCPDFCPDPIRDYIMLQCAEQILTASGYRKNHFVHYARERDRNLYFRHAFRGEDLLGLGASASGTFAGAEYRHHLLPEYLGAAGAMSAGIAGAVIASGDSGDRQRAEAMMMAGELRRELFAQVGCEGIFQGWERCALVRPDRQTGTYALTGTGSWLLQDMLQEFRLCDGQ
jgi:coproporphyrinogen III oxidase-like Fe-S oxidoreductase/sulfatase maturation enzyme AslB (radical SAM superfamily)